MRVQVLVARAAGVHPDLIPNPAVKPVSADGTALETMWESMPSPTLHSLLAFFRSAFCVIDPYACLRFHPSNLPPARTPTDTIFALRQASCNCRYAADDLQISLQ